MTAVGADNVYFEVQKNGLADPGQVQRGDRPDRARARAAAGRHRRRPLPAPRGLPPPRGAAVRADQVDAQPAEDHASTPTSSTCAPAEEMADSFAEWPEAIASHARDRRALQRRDRARPAADPALPDARRQRRGRVPARAGRARACATATATRCRPRRVERAEYELGVIDRMGFNAYFLIVWDFVKYAKDAGIAVGPGPRLGRRLDRRLLACRSPTSTRCATTCCSSASSTPSACRCPTSTSTSRCAAASA